MTKYAQAAINAVENVYSTGSSPIDAWDIELSKFYEPGSTSFTKGCPRNTFLGLCSQGLVKKIPAGHYTNSPKNKYYAIAAHSLLKEQPQKADDPNALWIEALAATGNPYKKPNGQMNIVCALHKSGYLI